MASSWKPYAGSVALMLLLGGGYYARNVAWTGSPVFPFAYEVFPARGWTPEMAREYSRSQAEFGFGRSPSDLLLLPWRLSMTPLNLLAFTPQGPVAYPQPLWPLSDAPGQDGTHNGLFGSLGDVRTTVLSPLLLALGAPALLMRRKPPALRAWMLAGGLVWIFWAATGQYARYLLPALALWCAACGWCADRLLDRAGLRAALACALTACCVTSLALCALSAPSWEVALGQRQPSEWLSSTFPGWRAMSRINRETPPNDGVAVWGEPRCLYLDRSYFWADDPHNQLLDYSKLKDWPTLKGALQKLGAKWVLWSTDPAKNQGFGGPPPEVAALIERNASLQIEERGYRVYRLD